MTASGHIPDAQLEQRTRGVAFAHLRSGRTEQGLITLDEYLEHR